jgi:Predicted protease of the Abi (CAAX) family
LAHVFWFAFPALVGAWLLGGQKQLMGLLLPKPAYLLVLALLLPTLALPLVQATFIPPEAFKLLPGLEGLESWARSQEAAVERQLMQFLAQDLWLNILVIALVPAVCEELFFRGLLQPLAVKRFGPWLGVLVVAVGFSLFHLQAYGFFSRMLLGLLLGLTVVFTGSLWMSILAHLANNLAAVVLGTLAVQGKISEAWLDSRAVNGWPWVLGSLVLTAALLYAVKRLAQTPAPASEEIDYGLAYEGLAAENPPEEPHP